MRIPAIAKRPLPVSLLLAGAAALAPAHPAMAATPTAVTFDGGFTLENVSTGAAIVCSESTMTGTIDYNSMGVAQISVQGVTAAGPGGSDCEGPLTIPVEVHLTGLAWTFTPTNYDFATQTTIGDFTEVGGTLHDAGGCDATFGGGTGTGTIKGAYTRPTGRLTLTEGPLEIESVDAECDPNLLNAGDRLRVDGHLQASPIT